MAANDYMAIGAMDELVERGFRVPEDILVMMQSIVSALARALPNDSPAGIVRQLNAVMTSNIRERLEQSEHATFVMLRYHSGGQVTMAGSHEEIIVYRAAEKRCERISQSGVWIGIADDRGRNS